MGGFTVDGTTYSVTPNLCTAPLDKLNLGMSIAYCPMNDGTWALCRNPVQIPVEVSIAECVVVVRPLSRVLFHHLLIDLATSNKKL